ncbi:MAG TPA: ComEC/Rec2 family competence protein, partial [Rhizomicrobium sp.]|nr:ComEC/Rec2 family competence protein [Rhizomicrobium sp.]
NEMRLATQVLNAPVVNHLMGRVVRLEPRGTNLRAVMDQVQSGGLSPLPNWIRIGFRGNADIGEWLSLTARLDTPPAPSKPGAADWDASLFFQSIGAVGFAYGRAHPVPAADPPGLGERLGAAVATLIAVAEWEQDRLPIKPRGMVSSYVRGITMTSLVGSLATLPFALLHFGRATHNAVQGNLIAMPVMGLWVMPAAALSVALMPFGLEAGSLRLLGRGIQVMVAMGKWVSHLPGAVTLGPAIPVAALIVMAVGGTWLMIWRKNWRWWGLVPVLLGVCFAWRAPRADMLVAADGRTVAIWDADGLLHFVRMPSDKYAARDWLRRDSDARDIADAVCVPGMTCDGIGCVVKAPKVNNLLIAVWLRPESLSEDCDRAQVLVSAADATNCKCPVVMIDQEAAKDDGGWRIGLSPTPTAQSVRQYRGDRPWVAALNTGE